MKDILTRITRYAYQTVPVYYNLAEASGINPDTVNFKDCPVVDKKCFTESGMSAISSKCIPEYMGGRLIWARTSGSTGKCSQVFWRRTDYSNSLLKLWLLRKKYYDIRPDSRLVYFFPADDDEREYVLEKNCLAVSRSFLYNGTAEKIYSMLVSYEPEWMILQPSLAVILCDCGEKYGKRPKTLKYIEFTGEYLDAEVHKRVEDVFQCKTANQYGTKEVNSIAYECPCKKLHIMSENVYVETLGDMPDEGEICVTSLQNYAMPFIRFNLEDRGKIVRNVSCACGRTGDILEIKAGRSDDWIWLADGRRLHSYVLLQIIHRLNYVTEGVIKQYQIVQKTHHSYDVFLVLEDDEFKEQIIDMITGGFQVRLGREILINFYIEEEILPSRITGKLASFVSECKRVNQ